MSTAFTTRPLKRGDAYYVQYNTDDLGGKMVGRPGVIVSCDKENDSACADVSMVFLTTSPQGGVWSPKITSTNRLAWACCSSLTRVSRARLGSYMATLSDREMADIDAGLADHLALDRAEKELTEDLEREKVKTEKLQSKIADLEKRLLEVTTEIEKKDLDCLVSKQAYDKVLERLVEKQIEFDFLKKLAQAPVVTPVEPLVVEPKPEIPEPVKVEPVKVEEPPALVDINRCSERELMDLGFSFSVARNITATRPFMKKDDLMIADGVTKVAYGLVKKKITVGDVSEYQKPKSEKPNVVKSDPLEEPEPKVELVNINTAKAEELHEKLGLNMVVAWSITGTRTRNGLYKSVEDLKKVPKFTEFQWKKCEGKVCV